MKQRSLRDRKPGYHTPWRQVRSIFFWPFIPPLCTQCRNHTVHGHYPFSTGGVLSSSERNRKEREKINRLLCSTFCRLASTVHENEEGEEDSNRLFIHVFTAHACSFMRREDVVANRACSRMKKATAIRGRPAQHDKLACLHVIQASSSRMFFLFVCFFSYWAPRCITLTLSFGNCWPNNNRVTKKKILFIFFTACSWAGGHGGHGGAYPSNQMCNQLSPQAVLHLSFQQYFMQFSFQKCMAHFKGVIL